MFLYFVLVILIYEPCSFSEETIVLYIMQLYIVHSAVIYMCVYVYMACYCYCKSLNVLPVISMFQTCSFLKIQ